MCTNYRITTNVEAMRRLFKVDHGVPVNLPEQVEVFPGYTAPVVRNADGGRELAMLRWGFPPPGASSRPVVNVRNLASPFWRNALATPARRCLVPVSGFVEWTESPDPATGRKRKVWFELTDAEVFAFAGIWRPSGEGDCFAFLTTAPNALVASIHPKAMPVILAPDEYSIWLEADYAAACALADAYPVERMRIAG